jgi:four helix bundle protein
MQTVHDLPIFQRSYDLYKEIYLAVKQYPKGDRYSLGDESKKISLEIISSVISAASSRNEWKATAIDKALTASELLKIHIRLAQETGCLKEQRHLSIQQKLQEIGRMLGGWKRSI